MNRQRRKGGHERTALLSIIMNKRGVNPFPNLVKDQKIRKTLLPLPLLQNKIIPQNLTIFWRWMKEEAKKCDDKVA